MSELLTFNVYVRILIEVGIHITLVLIFNCLKYARARYECVYNSKQNDVKKSKVNH